MWQDVRFAFRGLQRSPGFALGAVFALALGIGANAVTFGVINAVLLNPLVMSGWKDPARLTMIWERNPSLSLFFANRMPPRLRNVREWKEQNHVFTDVAAWRDTSFNLTAAGDSAGLKPEQVDAGAASPNFFPLIGISVRIGRGFSERDKQTAILSDELFQSRFAGDPRVLGSTMMADGKQYEIVGVLPRGFQMPAVWGGFDQKKPKMWVPLDMHPAGEDDERFVQYAFGRLKPGVSIEQAGVEMNIIGKRDPRNVGFGVNVTTVSEEDVGPDARRTLLVLQVAVFFVLLIACANTGNLLLTRAVARDKEIAVRAAMGASRMRIVRQTLTESLVLSLLGGGAGLLLSFWGLQALSAIAPRDFHGLHELRIDGTVLAFTMGVALFAGLLFGLAPAWHAGKENLNEVLNRSARSVSGSSQRLRNVLAAAEIALSLILLVGAGLTIRTVVSLLNNDLGFRPDHLLNMRVTLPEAKYGSAEQVAAFNRRLLDNVRQVPGVESATLTNALPMKSVNQSSFDLPGRVNRPGESAVSDYARANDGYFETLKIRVMEGRTFTREEARGKAPDVVVVNQAFSRTFFGGRQAIGKVIGFGGTKYRVIPDDELRSMLLVTRTTGDPLSMAEAVKQQVWSIDKDQPVSEVGTEEEALGEWLAPRRFVMLILLAFAGIALVLAAAGLYSVLAYSVTLRTKEIGIRMALGAQPSDVTRFVVRQGLATAAVGLAIGLAGALVLTRFMGSVLAGVSAADPVTFVGVAVLLLAVAVAASYIPALRASRVDPVEALRAE